MQEFFFVREDGKYVKVSFGEIIYVEGWRNYCKVVTPKKTFVILVTMKQVEEFLPASMFCRIHKSWIVALERIVSFDNEVVFLNDMTLPVGEQYKNRLLNSVTILVSENSKSYPNCFDKQSEKKKVMLLEE